MIKRLNPLLKFSFKLMAEFKVNYGNKKGLWDATYAKFIFSKQEDFSIINLQWTVLFLKKIGNFISTMTARGGQGFFIEKESFGEFFLNELVDIYMQQGLMGYWPGGFLSNFKEVLNKKKKFNFKKDPLINMDTYNRRAIFFMQFKRVPNYLYIYSVKRVFLPIQEAFKLGLPTIGVVDSNIRPYGLTYIIPGNDEAIKSIWFYTYLVFFSILKGMLLKRIRVKKFLLTFLRKLIKEKLL